jgi:Ser/Thr protein kinase RdoA (MazF antagonist)
VNSQVPEFSNEAIADISKSLYGIEGKVSSLVSYENQNARIETQKGSYSALIFEPLIRSHRK